MILFAMPFSYPPYCLLLFALMLYWRPEWSGEMDGQTIHIEKRLFQSLWSGWMGLNESGELPGFNILFHQRGGDRNQSAGIMANDVNS